MTLLCEVMLLMVALVETGNKDIPAYKGPADGPFQIMPCTIKEANRIVYLQDPRLGPNFYEPNDIHDYYMARSIAFVVCDFWKPKLEAQYKCKWTPKDVLAFWLYGPNEWRPSSKYTEDSQRRNKRYAYYMKQRNDT